jgi:hypothetical protein
MTDTSARAALRMVRGLVAGSIVARALTTPHTSLSQSLRLMNDSPQRGWRRGYGAARAGSLVAALVGAASACSDDRRLRLVGAGALAASAALHARIDHDVSTNMAGFSGYYQHLTVGAAIIAVGDGTACLLPSRVDAEQMTLRALRHYYGSVYALSALAKLRHSGPSWWLHPWALRHAELTYGSVRPADVLDLSALRLVAATTVALELAAWPAALASERARVGLGITLALFHLGLAQRLRISFWHLSAPFVAVLAGPALARATSRVWRPGLSFSPHARRPRAG